MKDSEQAKFIRWGVPGWTMFLAFFGFVFIDVIFTQDSSSNKILKFVPDFLEVSGLTTSLSTAVVGFIVAAAGIPLGFLIYQIYFYVRWNSPISRFGIRPPFVMGRDYEIERTLKGISSDQLATVVGIPCDEIEDGINGFDHSQKWRSAENALLIYFDNQQTKSHGEYLYNRYKYLVDLLHILGAALFGIYIGFVGYLILKAKIDKISTSLLVLISFLAIAALLGFLENVQFSNPKEYKSIELVNKFLLSFDNAIAFVYGIGACLYLGSPSMSSSNFVINSIYFRIAVLLVIAYIYTTTVNHNKVIGKYKEFWIFIVVGGVFFICLSYLSKFAQILPWSFGWVTFAFLLINVVFIKNRQNTRDDLIFLQNITLRKCVNEIPEIDKNKSTSVLE